MIEKLAYWLLLLHILCAFHQGDTRSADTCCKFDTNCTTYSCRGCGLTEVPQGIPTEVTTLDLADNNLTLIKDNVFSSLSKLVYLYLNNNQIRHVSINALLGLRSLKELDLRKNLLCIDDANLGGIFKDTPHLKILQLVHNHCKKPIRSFPDKSLKPLKELEKISLPFVKNVDLGPVFGDLSNLKYLMILGSESPNNDGGNLGCSAFKTLSNVSLEMLSVRNSGIKKVCLSALVPLKKLRYLNFACNKNVPFGDINEAVNKLSRPSLQTLILDRTGAGELSTELSKYNYSYSWENLRKFSARFMNSVHLTIKSFDFFMNMPELRYLGIPGNMVFVSYSHKAKKQLIEFVNKTKIETVDFSHFGGTGYNENKFYNQYCYPDNIHDEPDLFFRKPPEDVFPPIAPENANFSLDGPATEGKFFLRNLPLSLHYFYFDFFTFGLVNIFQIQPNPSNQILLASFSNSGFFGRFRTWRNMTNLQIIDASNCGFNDLERKPLNYTSLQKLLLSGNNLQNIGASKAKWSPFQLMTKLKYIAVDDNKISYIQPSAFQNLPLLQGVRLNRNHLTTLDFNFTGSPAIKSINISQNLITSLSKAFMQSMDVLASKHKVDMDISGNNFDCSCQSLSFIKWFQTTKVQIARNDATKCADGNKIADINTIEMTIKCFFTRRDTYLVLAAVVPAALVVIIVCLVFKIRHRFQSRYHIMNESTCR